MTRPFSAIVGSSDALDSVIALTRTRRGGTRQGRREQLSSRAGDRVKEERGGTRRHCGGAFAWHPSVHEVNTKQHSRRD